MIDCALRPIPADEVVARSSEFGALYAGVYAESPYNEPEEQADEFVSHLVDHSALPGFALVVAERRADTNHLVGFAYGFTFSADRWWRGAGGEPELTRGSAKFAVMELVVAAQWRGKGMGRALMSSLLSGRIEPFATLCANPAAPARNIYRSWGWEQVAVSYPPNMGPMDVLVKRLG